ncbi:MAG TPA: PQQ-binding-like beta-propeller repeat protein [Kofleriaceae bacterium]|nr:PQQ-binding-like beta-propeller repeat protein [Kofleriaceae bacterium]
MPPATALRCPQCDAALKDVSADAEVATCAYCGTTSRLQRRSRVLEIPIRTAPPPEHRSLPVARQAHTGRFKAGCLVAVLALAGGGLAIGWCIKKKFFDKTGWDGLAAPILYDVNGDGTLDAIGRSRYVRSGDSMHLIAIDGRDGSVLWESPKEGSYSDVYQNVIMRDGDTLLVADQGGGLTGWAARTGKRLWHTELGERTRYGCVGDAGSALVTTTDQRWHRIGLADGTRSDAAEPAACAALASYATGSNAVAAGLQITDHGSVEGMPYQIEGMQISKAIRRLPDGLWFAIGYRTPGTAVPMAAMLKPDMTVAWTTVIPEKPMNASESSPDYFTLSKDSLIVIYQTRSSQFRVAAFAQTNGLRRWDVGVPKGFFSVCAGVVASESHVFVSMWSRLEVFDLATGSHKYTVGD